MKKILLSTVFLGLATAQATYAAPNKPSAAELRRQMMEMLAQQEAEEKENNAKIAADEKKAAEKREATRKKQQESNEEFSKLEERIQNVENEAALQDLVKKASKAVKDFEKAERGSQYIDRNMDGLYEAYHEETHEYKKASNEAARQALELFSNLPKVDYKKIKEVQKQFAKQPLKNNSNNK